MKLDRLHLSDFRGFANFDLDLDPQMTLLVGRNGSGKTGVLEGLAVALGAWFSGFSGSEVRTFDRSIQKRDARLTRTESQGLPTLEASYPVIVEAEGTIAGERVRWRRELRHADGRTTHGDAKRIRELARETEDRLADDDNPVDLPVIGYYAAGRLWVQKRDKQRDLQSRLDGYSAALEVASDPKLFEAWMAWRESDRLQQIARASQAGRVAIIRSPHLEAVQAAARTCLEGSSNIYYSVNYQELRVEFEDGSELPFDRLSDGQRSLVAMAADIAWRCAQLNPHYGSEAAQRTAGVVLIDEIELHLHPAWQRRVLADLHTAFPEIQFVATTHSPQVISTARREWVRVLRSGAEHAFDAGHVQGRDVNSIMWELMGVRPRPDDAQARIDETEQLIEQGRLSEAKQALDELREQMSEEDDAVRHLDWELRDRELEDAID